MGTNAVRHSVRRRESDDLWSFACRAGSLNHFVCLISAGWDVQCITLSVIDPPDLKSSVPDPRAENDDVTELPDSEQADAASLPAKGRLAGLDYGTRRIGVAVSTPEQTIASPHETYTRRSLSRDAEYLTQFIRENRIVGVVVGLPMHTGGEEGIKAAEAREFGAWVATTVNRPVAFWDERFTTAVASDLLREAGVPRSKRKARLDKLAAQILLQSYLDARPPR